MGGFGVPSLYLRREEGSRWVANFRLPPGLDPGWKEVRLRTAGSPFSGSLRIAVDVPLVAGRLEVREACGGRTWAKDRVQEADQGMISLWVAGLAENADRANVRVHLGGSRLTLDYVSAPDASGCRQINARLPGEIRAGDYPLPGFRREAGR